MKPPTRTNLTSLLLVAVALILSLVRAPYPEQTVLQHSATLLGIAFLLLDLRRGWLRPGGQLCFSAFLLLHIVGARWIYSYVPYDAWGQAMLGLSIQEHFGWQRNQYDRLVHFCFGLLLLPGAMQLLQRRMPQAGWALLVAWLGIQFFSMLYELFEWGLTLTLAPEMADSYNGQQGDPWDAHKDMALALLGATLSVAVICWGRWRK